MSTFYTYDQTHFVNTSKVDLDKFKNDIVSSAISSATLLYINMSESGVNFSLDIYFSTELSNGDQQILDDLVQNYIYEDNSETICVIKDVKSVGTNGGSFDSSWTTRDLNTIEGNVNFVTLSNNQFTLISGKYYLDIKAPACNVQNHQMRLYNVTDNEYYMGTNAFASGGLMTNSELKKTLDITSSKTFEVQHMCSSGNSSGIGFGRAAGFSSEEVYTTIFISKL
jgi:hypothetical protein